MIRLRPLLAAIGLAFVATATLTPTAAADNCDIFINPEDCQNTGWTIGTIAVLTGGVAVATAAVMTANHTPTAPPPPPLPPPAPLPGSPPPRMPRPQRPRDEDTIEGVAVRPTLDTPTITLQGENGRTHSVRLVVRRDAGTQEVHDGPH